MNDKRGDHQKFRQILRFSRKKKTKNLLLRLLAQRGLKKKQNCFKIVTGNNKSTEAKS